MALVYTTLDNINTRLQTRLQMGGAAIALGKSVIGETELLQIAEQVEARVSLRVSQQYLLPLKLVDENLKGAIASVVEKLTICDVLGTYFSNTNPAQEGIQTQDIYCKQGERELEAMMGFLFVGEDPRGITAYSQSRSTQVGSRASGTRIEF
jgi:hypothetical protein